MNRQGNLKMWPIQNLGIFCDQGKESQYWDCFKGYCEVRFFSLSDLCGSKEPVSDDAVLIDFSGNPNWLSSVKNAMEFNRHNPRNSLLVLDEGNLKEMIVGGELGVFDFILKPFGKNELLYRV